MLNVRFLFRVIGVAALQMAIAPPAGHITAQPQGVDPLIGTWILNVAKSTYEGVAAPKSEMRTFDYHGEGTILYTRHTVSQRGTRSFGHFIVTLDGKEHPEYARGATQPGALVAFTRVDANHITA